MPVVAVIRAVRKLKPDIELSWIGGKNSLEENFAKKEGVQFFGIQTGKWRRYFDFQNFIDAFRIPVGFYQALRLLKRLKPDTVFAKGGYVSFPVGFAAKTLRIPLVLHESDATPGLATRFLAPFAKKIFLGFEPAAKKEKVEVVGTPVREEILTGQVNEARLFLKKVFGHAPTVNLPTVLVIGGSLGAASLNELVWSSLPELTKFCQVIHLTGRGKSCHGELVEPGQLEKSRYFPLEYADAELPHLYAISDLVVTRAGASVISELIALRKPHILVPLGTHASRGDQWANAKYCLENFKSPVLSEATLTKDEFISEIKKNLESGSLKKAHQAIPESLSITFQQSAQKIADALLLITLP